MSATAFTEYMKYYKVTWVLTISKYYIFTWYLGITLRQYLAQKIISKLDIQAVLSIFLDFTRDWDHYKNIPDLTFPLPPYAQGRIQEQAGQLILIQRLNMKLSVMQYHTN